MENAVTSTLTPRETEISVLIKDGLTNKDIAEMLELSVFVVRNYRIDIIWKISAENIDHRELVPVTA